MSAELRVNSFDRDRLFAFLLEFRIYVIDANCCSLEISKENMYVPFLERIAHCGISVAVI